MLGTIRPAVVAVIAAAAVVAISTSANAQYGYYGGYGPYARGYVTSDVYLSYGHGYYGSGRYSGPFRTDSSPGGSGGQ